MIVPLLCVWGTSETILSHWCTVKLIASSRPSALIQFIRPQMIQYRGDAYIDSLMKLLALPCSRLF
jgi:hypothetical protein